MNNQCQLHPTKKADYFCEPCNMAFCEKCSGEANRHHRNADAACFICNSGMHSLSSSEKIAPFWTRLKAIYQYPVGVEAMITIVVLALASTVLGGLFVIIPAVAMTLYSFACLRATASGEEQAPSVTHCFEGSIGPVFYALISMAAGMSLALFSFNSFGLGVGIIVSLVLAFLMPAAIIVIAIEERLLPALNLGMLLSIVRATGVSYFIMVLLLIVMMSSMGVLVSLFGSSNFAGLSVFMASLIGNYYNIVIYHIMGYLVYQHHQELGYRVTGKAGVKQSKQRSGSEMLMAQTDVLIKTGHYEAAREVAKRNLTNTSPVWQWAKVVKLLCIAKPCKDLPRYFERYLSKLSEAGDSQAMADTYLEVLRVTPNVSINDELRRLDVAQGLIDLGKYPQAINLIKDLPQSSDVSSNVMSALKLLAEVFSYLPGSEKHVTRYQALYEEEAQKVG